MLEKTVTPDVSKEGFGQAAATQDESQSAIIARDRQLAKLGYLNERGAVFKPSAVASMLA